VDTESLAALRATSRVVYPSAPEDPHQLQITLAGSGYARFRLASDPETQGRRILHHLLPAGAYVTEARSATSVQLEGAGSTEVMLWAALREQLYDGSSGATWEADPAGTTRRTLRIPGVGRLEAEWEPNSSNPQTLSAWDESGEPIQSLRHIQWQPGPGPPTPTALDMYQGDQLVWHEDRFSVQRGLTLRSDFFLPPDRRDPTDRVQATRRSGD